MKFTKLDAAGAQLDAAIGHFLAGDWVPAIHCAGAAEELYGRLIERHGEKTVPDALWEKEDFTDLVPNKKEFIRYLNISRDWVKHTNKNHADEMGIVESHALLSVHGAVAAYVRLFLSGLAPQRQSVDRFAEWASANGELTAEIGDDLAE
jgi:hypothetical protein